MIKLKYGIVFMLFQPQIASSASFDCTKASTKNEVAICSNEYLSFLDEELASVYRDVRGLVSDSDKLKDEQIGWIKSLGTCDGNASCLIDGYVNRIRILDYIDGKIDWDFEPVNNQDLLLDQREADLDAREAQLIIAEENLTEERLRLEQLTQELSAPQVEVSPPTPVIVAANQTPTEQTVINFDLNLAEAYCADAWTERGQLDTDMFSYCLEQQTDGYASVLELVNRYTNIEPIENINEIAQFAFNKWAKPRDYQMDMVAYEIETQGESYLNVQYELGVGSVSVEKYNECRRKWLSESDPEWSMVEYCTEN